MILCRRLCQSFEQKQQQRRNNHRPTAIPLTWKLFVLYPHRSGKYQQRKYECGWKCKKWVGKVYLRNVLVVFGLVPFDIPVPRHIFVSPVCPFLILISIFVSLLIVFSSFFLEPPKKFAWLCKCALFRSPRFAFVKIIAKLCGK